MAKRKAIIVDIDGTIAYMVGRGPYDAHLAHTDKPHTDIIDLISRYRHDHIILMVTGRDAKYKDCTRDWLRAQGFQYESLWMRPLDDKRQDAIIKKEIYNSFIKEKYDITLVLEDRSRVVAAWRELGLRCLQVAEGNF